MTWGWERLQGTAVYDVEIISISVFELRALSKITEQKGIDRISTLMPYLLFPDLQEISDY